ncbi:hypothetical protein MicloDRAFT_00054700 [Microvirga lotononidis]|uniref:Uncharacterized protein n=1 Tax=Microvirga lotononidis TaxID=864069 RepID=I4YLA9_9HYPH|nr:hypothetical protein MicloDRAFT_00054700 [Microvirga lotononidis]
MPPSFKAKADEVKTPPALRTPQKTKAPPHDLRQGPNISW